MAPACRPNAFMLQLQTTIRGSQDWVKAQHQPPEHPLFTDSKTHGVNGPLSGLHPSRRQMLHNLTMQPLPHALGHKPDKVNRNRGRSNGLCQSMTLEGCSSALAA